MTLDVSSETLNLTLTQCLLGLDMSGICIQRRLAGRSNVFLPRCMKCRRGLAMRILSVCPSVRPSVRLSVCLSHACIVTKR